MYRLEAWSFDKNKWVLTTKAPSLVHAMTWVCVNAYAVDCGHRVVDEDGQVIAKGSYAALCSAKADLLFRS